MAIAEEDLAAATDPADIEDLQAVIQAYTWQKSPTEAIKSYRLANKRLLYRPFENELNDYESNFVGNPFNLETMNYGSLPQKLKDAVPLSGSYIGYDGRVIFLIPDLNYVEPFVIEEESYLKGTYVYALTPESLQEDPDRVNQKDTTGEETYTRTSRRVLSKKKYTELTGEYSSQETGFERVFSKVTESEVSGQLPEAQVRKANWQDRAQKVRNRDPSRLTRYFAESDYLTSSVSSGDSLSFPTAASLGQALTAAKTDLRIKTWQESTQSKKCAWYYPQVRPGDYIATPRDLFGEMGNWRLLNVSFALEVKGGRLSGFDRPLVLTEGTTFSTGLDIPRNISYREEPDLRDRQPAEDDTTVKMKGQTKLGEIILSTTTRRNITPPASDQDPTTPPPEEPPP